ncbi:hypothetical protein KAR34_06430 [bacterium]|nr:hypothetical protein [bacterium]
MKTFLAITAVMLLVLLAMNTNIGINSWLLLIEKENYIPHESNIFHFRPTVMNTGSGDWWIYGEDDKYYYYFFGGGKYNSLIKEEARKIDGFSPIDVETWPVLEIKQK